MKRLYPGKSSNDVVLGYALFACANDLGNGFVVYPLLSIGTALFIMFATAIAFVSHAREEWEDSADLGCAIKPAGTISPICALHTSCKTLLILGVTQRR